MHFRKAGSGLFVFPQRTARPVFCASGFCVDQQQKTLKQNSARIGTHRLPSYDQHQISYTEGWYVKKLEYSSHRQAKNRRKQIIKFQESIHAVCFIGFLFFEAQSTSPFTHREVFDLQS
ncbi:hypothetical protein PCANC_06796 [Puccinia coronata f. sp. avenae]|uniref:Uncharacterized protein n=1 Tax=Puccinia coronata f. sp. avenae TaxID=200324 RepID=A0A2N5UU02_9BASI|nr:hypothetical protein PCANC_06796 [Puccinia coronata f. sp. avenae]